jgi:RNA polymerase sigma factor (sigma-70 family)
MYGPPDPDRWTMDDTPFETLLTELGPEIFAFLWRIVGDGPEAEDCFQDTFLRAYKARPRLEGIVNRRAWLYTIAGNVARTHLKRRGNHAAHNVALDEERSHGGASVERIIEGRQDLERLRRAMHSLPYKQRAALMLRKYHGMEYAEIATVLGGSQDAARANVYQGLRRLRAEFGREPRLEEG